jgi:hypothetical protein
MQTFRSPVSFYGQFSELPVPVKDSLHGVLTLPASRISLGEAAKFSYVPRCVYSQSPNFAPARLYIWVPKGGRQSTIVALCPPVSDECSFRVIPAKR